jgi:hypothetical protein
MDLGKEVGGRNFVASGGIGSRVVRRNGLEDFTRTPDEQTAAFIGRVTSGVGNNRRQRFAIDADLRQPR